jgi:multiple sugar transport system ATP-binding protein
MARVLLTDLTKAYDENVRAVDRLNLEVKDKEFIVLLGPSGCGKTTTLRCIAGLESPTDGEIRIGDRVVNDLEPKARNIAMVFQSYALYPHMTAYENVAFPLENAKTARREIVRRVNQAARLLEIEGLLDRKPAQLSGGQRQRVALGRAIIREPDAFLMDEPLRDPRSGMGRGGIRGTRGPRGRAPSSGPRTRTRASFAVRNPGG